MNPSGDEFNVGEQVMTAGEKIVKFIAGKQRDKGEEVYNYEVWREHNYYVGIRRAGSLCWCIMSVMGFGKKHYHTLDQLIRFCRLIIYGLVILGKIEQ
jgi:hypothetical protein